jgi:hypothetical protein
MNSREDLETVTQTNKQHHYGSCGGQSLTFMARRRLMKTGLGRSVRAAEHLP